MAVDSPSELIDTLRNRDFERLRGTLESAWIDFKRDPSRLEDPRQKWELCKDVAAFANVGAGYVLVGVETEKHQDELVEAASRMAFVSRDAVDLHAPVGPKVGPNNAPLGGSRRRLCW